jgi:thiamine biosynthesis lipoprotein ApbE
VVSKSAVDAEILSTALLLAGDEEKIEILEKLRPEKATEIVYNSNQPDIKDWYNKSENISYEKSINENKTKTV